MFDDLNCEGSTKNSIRMLTERLANIVDKITNTLFLQNLILIREMSERISEISRSKIFDFILSIGNQTFVFFGTETA